MWAFRDSELRYGDKAEEYDLDKLWIEYWNKETNVQADFNIKWYYFPREKPTPQMQIFNDSWKALYEYGQDFLKMLSDNDNVHLSKEEFKEELLKIGFVDKTFDND